MKDYYSILHVLPSAEIDVIKAAYKALARKYHPDTFNGDKAYAGKRMQEINDAFGVIGDPDKRKKYDAERKAANQEDEFTSNDNDVDTRLEEDWLVACKYCPEATEGYNHLNKLSRSLAFAFKSYLLDSKQFSECQTIRDKFRTEFLNNYFGSNPAVQEIGEKLVLAGELKAAKSVNRAVKVMGGTLDVNNAIKSLHADYPHLKDKLKLDTSEILKLQLLFCQIRDNKNNLLVYEDSISLCEKLLKSLNIPFEVNSFWGYFRITYQGSARRVSNRNMCRWIVNALGSHPHFRDI